MGHWITPLGAPRRYDTHFFLARYRQGEVVADREELTAAWWERPGDILRRVDEGQLDAILLTLELLRARCRNIATSTTHFSGTGSGSRRGNPDGWTGF
ncbi:MAG: hypothetical protein R2695_02665 [Acidimicrobiales bacterium]